MVDSKKKHGEEFVYFNPDKRTLKIEMEKRVLRRIPADTELFVGVSEKQLYKGKLRDLSGSGAKIEVGCKLERDQIIDIRITEQSPPFATLLVTRVAEPSKVYGVRWVKVFVDHLPKGLLTKKRV